MSEQISLENFIREIESSGELFGIGLHGIHSGSYEDKKCVAEKILESGLNLQYGWNSVLSTAISLGNEVTANTLNDMTNYRYGDGEQCNIIILSPMLIENSIGEKLFLGFPDKNVGTAAQQYVSTCIFDQVCGKLGKIPVEFVYGYYDEKSSTVVQNPNYYAKVPSEKRDELFEKIKSAMNNFSKTVSDATIKGNIRQLEEMRASFAQMGWKEPILDNAINLLNKNDQQFIKDNSVVQVSQGEEILNKKITNYAEQIPVRRTLWGSTVDATALSKRKEALKEVYKQFNVEDFKNITNENVDTCKKAMQLMQKIPQEFTMDKLLEEDLMTRLSAYNQKGRRVLTDDYRKEKKSIEAEFDMCIASFLMTGKTDIFNRFYKLINNMNRVGMNINIGKSIVGFGEVLAKKLEELQNNSQRNSKAWSFLLAPILHAYTVAQSIDNKRWNPREHNAFEERLVKLGLIELSKEQQLKIETPKATSITKNNSLAEKGSVMQPVVLEKAIREQVIYQYINTGMVPEGFKISDVGDLVKETQIDVMRREQIRKNMEKQKASEEARLEQKAKEMQRQKITISGQAVRQPVEAKITNRVDKQQTRINAERYRLER